MTFRMSSLIAMVYCLDSTMPRCPYPRYSNWSRSCSRWALWRRLDVLVVCEIAVVCAFAGLIEIGTAVARAGQQIDLLWSLTTGKSQSKWYYYLTNRVC